MRQNTKKVKKYNPFKELMTHFNFATLTLLTKSLTFAVRFFLFNNQIEYDLNDNVMKMVNMAKKYYKRVPIDSITNEHDFILLSDCEGVYRSIGYHDVYQVYEEVSKSIVTKQDYDFRICEEKF